MLDLSMRATVIVAALPSPTSALAGVVVQLSGDGNLYHCDGSVWVALSRPGLFVNHQSGNYTTTAADFAIDTALTHKSADTGAVTYTLASQATVPLTEGAMLVIRNCHGAGAVTIASAAEVLRWENGGGLTGPRILTEGTAVITWTDGELKISGSAGLT